MKIDTDDFKGKVFKVEDCENGKVHFLSKYLLRPSMLGNGVREVNYTYNDYDLSVLVFNFYFGSISNLCKSFGLYFDCIKPDHEQFRAFW